MALAALAARLSKLASVLVANTGSRGRRVNFFRSICSEANCWSWNDAAVA